MKEYYVVGKIIGYGEIGTIWDFAGIFDDKTLAVKACIDENYFVGAAKLNEFLPEERIDWPDVFFPLDVL